MLSKNINYNTVNNAILCTIALLEVGRVDFPGALDKFIRNNNNNNNNKDLNIYINTVLWIIKRSNPVI